MSTFQLILTPLALVSLGACAAPRAKTCMPTPPPPPVVSAPCPKPAANPDLDLFLQGIAELGEGGGEATLALLSKEHPSSPFTTAASMLLERGIQLAATKAEHVKAQQTTVAAEREREVLANRVLKLEAALEKLKHLAIESELRSK